MSSLIATFLSRFSLLILCWSRSLDSTLRVGVAQLKLSIDLFWYRVLLRELIVGLHQVWVHVLARVLLVKLLLVTAEPGRQLTEMIRVRVYASLLRLLNTSILKLL